MEIVLLLKMNADSTVYDTSEWISSLRFFCAILVSAHHNHLFITHCSCVMIITCVFMSRASIMNDCVRPPLNPSEHRIPSDVIEIFVIVQLCTWSGRPEIQRFISKNLHNIGYNKSNASCSSQPKLISLNWLSKINSIYLILCILFVLSFIFTWTVHPLLISSFNTEIENVEQHSELVIPFNYFHNSFPLFHSSVSFKFCFVSNSKLSRHWW